MPTMDLEGYETLISVMVTPSHEGYQQAVDDFDMFKHQDLDKLALGLANVLEKSTNAEIRARSAILLTELLDEPVEEPLNEPFEGPLAVDTRSLVKDSLLRCIEKEKERIVRKNLCHTIATTFNVFPNNGWPELDSFLRRCVSSHNDLLQEEAAMMMLGSMDLYNKFGPISVETYIASLTNAHSADVRIAALGATLNYVYSSALFNRDIYVPDVRLVPVMMQVLTEGLNGGLEVTTQKALKLLIEWFHRRHPHHHYSDESCSRTSRIYRLKMRSALRDTEMDIPGRILVGFVGSAFEIAESHTLERQTSHLAIDFLITLWEGYVSMMRDKFPYAFNRLFGILMLMLSDMQNEDDDAGESINYSIVLEFLHRLAVKLYNNTVVWLVLEQYMAAREWQKRVAAIVAFAHIYEVSKKVTKESFDKFRTMVLELFKDAHPRVRLAAIDASGRLSTNLDRGLQLDEYHGHVLPALATAICDFEYTRVQDRAVSAMVNISSKCLTSFVQPYLHETVSTLLQNVCASDQTRRPTINILREFREKLPSDAWLATWVDLSRDKQLELESLLRS